MFILICSGFYAMFCVIIYNAISVLQKSENRKKNAEKKLYYLQTLACSLKFYSHLSEQDFAIICCKSL